MLYDFYTYRKFSLIYVMKLFNPSNQSDPFERFVDTKDKSSSKSSRYIIGRTEVPDDDYSRLKHDQQISQRSFTLPRNFSRPKKNFPDMVSAYIE